MILNFDNGNETRVTNNMKETISEEDYAKCEVTKYLFSAF